MHETFRSASLYLPFPIKTALGLRLSEIWIREGLQQIMSSRERMQRRKLWRHFCTSFIAVPTFPAEAEGKGMEQPQTLVEPLPPKYYQALGPNSRGSRTRHAMLTDPAPVVGHK